jgi:NAD(P)H-nitrite reductase large subunit
VSKSYVIIGASAAGISAINTLRRLDPDANITCITDEPETPYNKCFLADYLAGSKTQEQLHIFTAAHAQEKKVHLIQGMHVVSLIAEHKQIQLADGRLIAYDALFIGTGTRPVVPTVYGISSECVFNFHGMAHARDLLDFIKNHLPKRAIVLGAGLSGLECADALSNYGIKVFVVEQQDVVLSRLVDQSGGDYIAAAMQRAGVYLSLGTVVQEVVTSDEGVEVVLSSGYTLAADLLVCALGAKPNSAFVATAGATMQQAWIQVDDTMKTSLPTVYAGGDVVVVQDQLSGSLVPSCTWSDAMHQGMVAAHNMVGQQKSYPGVMTVTSSAFFGIKFASCGAVAKPLPVHEIVRQSHEHEYKLFLLEDAYLRGFLLVGASINLNAYRRMVLTRQEIDKKSLSGF